MAPSGGSGAACMQIWHLYLECPTEPPARSCINWKQQAIISNSKHPWNPCQIISCVNDTHHLKETYCIILDDMFHDISAYSLDHPLMLLIIHHSQVFMCYVSECHSYQMIKIIKIYQNISKLTNFYKITSLHHSPPLLPRSCRTAMSCAPSALANRLHDSRWHPSPGRINERIPWEPWE